MFIYNLDKCRVLTMPEDKNMDKNAKYVLGYDVVKTEGKNNVKANLVVIKVKKMKDEKYSKHLVNIYNLEHISFAEQAEFLKKKIKDFNACALCVDTNGLGRGLVDYLPIESHNGQLVYTDNSLEIFDVSVVDDIHNIYNILIDNISKQTIKLLQEKAERNEDNNKLQAFTMTDVLCDEIINLQEKQKDKHTRKSLLFAFLYGLLWIHLQESN